MADPLSVAGLVTGVISLGLQVAGGLSDYLGAVKGRIEELHSAKKQATEMRDLLSTIEDLFSQVESSWPAAAAMIKHHVKSCNTELSALHALLSELSQPTSAGSGIRLRLAEQKKKLTYPFNRSDISRLEERLSKVNSALQTALQVAELNITITSANQIRQVYDLVLSLSQPQGTGTCLSLPERTTRGATIIALDSIETAMSLASKPSLLSNSIQTLDEHNTVHAPLYNRSRICSCPPSYKMSNRRSSWGYFSFSHRTSITRRHLPDCPFSQIDSETQTTSFSVEYGGLRNLLQMAFVLSFANTWGAGGRSISPCFTYYPTIDERTAPVFRIMRLVGEVLFFEPRTDEKFMKTVQCCFDSIFVLYNRKKASPKDITLNGESLLNIVVHVFGDILIQGLSCKKTDLYINLMVPIIAKLVACGVPVDRFNSIKQTPSGHLLWLDYSGVPRELVKLMLPAEPDIPLVEYQRFRTLRTLRTSAGVLATFLEDTKLAEASGCGPLSLAARAGDERLVQDLIKRDPQSLEESNSFGYTPLHLAINHPSCLRLIIQASGSSLLEKSVNTTETPLACACRLGCRTAIQILLASGACISETCADESCIDDVLIALKQRRDALKLLALENLTEAEAESFGLHENVVLDGWNALEVQSLMLKRGIDIPPRLYLDTQYLHPVYHFSTYPRCRQVSLFDKLWALGFRDLGNFNGPNNIPLLRHGINPKATRWLMEHGADYWTPLGERSNSANTMSTVQVTPAHLLSWTIGYLSRLRLYSHQERLWILEKSLQVRVGDTCSCPCSVGGCTPLKLFWHGFLRSDQPRSSQEHAQLGLNAVQTFPTSFSGEDFVAALRCITFDALGLTHTCCDVDRRLHDYEASRHTPEEVDEINSEQSTLLTLFADLLVEFGRIALEDRDGAPLIVHDPEEFWMRRWLPQMTETLDSLDGDDLTEEERSAAEAIGVVWGSQPAPIVREDRRYTPEYVMEELEKIMNE